MGKVSDPKNVVALSFAPVNYVNDFDEKIRHHTLTLYLAAESRIEGAEGAICVQ